jgi:hypothetical protein
VNRPDPKKMTFDQLQQYLEQELPGFAFSIHHYGRGMPVSLSYRHQHRGLSEYGARFPWGSLGGTYPTTADALRTIAERYHAFQDEQAGKTAQEAATAAQQHVRQVAQLQRQRQAEPEPAAPTKPAEEAPEPAPEPSALGVVP